MTTYSARSGSEYSIRNLPPVGSYVTNRRGTAYLVTEVHPETRQYPDSGAGFVFGLRVDKAGQPVVKRAVRIYGGDIATAEVPA